VHRKDVCALEPITGQGRSPAAPGQLRGDVMLPDGLRLLCVHHVGSVSPGVPTQLPETGHPHRACAGRWSRADTPGRVAVIEASSTSALGLNRTQSIRNGASSTPPKYGKVLQLGMVRSAAVSQVACSPNWPTRTSWAGEPAATEGRRDCVIVSSRA